MTRLQELIHEVLKQYTEYLGWDEETAESMHGINKEKLPKLEETLTYIIKLHYPIIKK